MGRPLKNNAEWFNHNANDRNSKEMRAIRSKYGIEGYGVTLMLLEELCNSEFFQIENTSLNIELLSGDFNIKPELLSEIISYLVTIQFFTCENNFIRCAELTNRLQGLIAKRKTLSTESAQEENSAAVQSAEFPTRKPMFEIVSDAETPRNASFGSEKPVQQSRVQNKTEQLGSKASRSDFKENFSEKDFCLRLSNEEMVAFIVEIQRMIFNENKERRNNPFQWKNKSNSFESDMRILIYKIPDEDKKTILYEVLNIYKNKMNWAEYVKDCVLFVVRKSLTRKVDFALPLVMWYLRKPAEICSAKFDGVLSMQIFPLIKTIQ